MLPPLSYLANPAPALMNIWTRKSIEFATQRNYLDMLFRVYPVNLNLQRKLPEQVTSQIESLCAARDNIALISLLLKQEIFPVKDSYVAFLKKDPAALARNPLTCDRLAGILYEMGPEEIIAKATAPKEANRQIGPLFKNWINSGALGCKVTPDANEVAGFNGNIVLAASDHTMKQFAENHLGYHHDKGLDLVCKFNGKYVIGEAKFLTDYGGHQNAQFADAISTLKAPLRPSGKEVIKIAILDGVIYLPGRNRLHQGLLASSRRHTLLSALFLRDFLYTL